MIIRFYLIITTCSLSSIVDITDKKSQESYIRRARQLIYLGNTRYVSHVYYIIPNRQVS